MNLLNSSEFNPYNKRIKEIEKQAEENPEGDLEFQFDKATPVNVDTQPDDTDVPEDPYARPDYKKLDDLQ